MERLKVISYISSFESNGVSAVANKHKILLVTGQSSIDSCRISDSQYQFLRKLIPSGVGFDMVGFPWHPEFDRPEKDPVGLIAASLRNGLQFLYAQFSPKFRRGLGRKLTERLSGSECILLIVGSCGYQLANAGLATAKDLQFKKILILGLGSVGFTKVIDPRIKEFQIRGKSDYWSRIFSNSRTEYWSNCRHLEYWDNEEVQMKGREAINGFFE